MMERHRLLFTPSLILVFVNANESAWLLVRDLAISSYIFKEQEKKKKSKHANGSKT